MTTTKKIWLIIEREYLTRVRKKTFIVMTILGPLLIASFYGIIFWTAASSGEEKNILVIDESQLFIRKFSESEKLHFFYEEELNLEKAKQSLLQEKRYDAILYIPAITPENPNGITIFSEKALAVITQQFIEKTIEKELENIKLEKIAGISKDVLKSVETRLSINTITLTKEGEKSANMGVATLVGIICGLIIYMFVFLYSVQVMRGVMEEKMNRIVEIIISSVRPFELMMGKIIGIAGVGLTQIFIWFVLGTIIISGLTFFFGVDTATIQQASELSREMDTSSTNAPVIHTVDDALYALSMLNVKLLVISFVFYFLFGYLIYAALFGAIGAAVDTESDTQQFMLPITIPLVLAISLSSSIISEPNGQIAFWLSMIPLTSPVAMMIRLPFLELGWEVFLSMFLLVVSFLGVTWMAAKIYRVGILMYGKKTTYKELAKWLFY